MAFEPAGDFLLVAAQKYKLKDQAAGALVCEKIRRFFSEHYPSNAPAWIPQKYLDRVLFVKVGSAAARSALFLETHAMLERIKDQRLADITEIRIIK